MSPHIISLHAIRSSFKLLQTLDHYPIVRQIALSLDHIISFSSSPSHLLSHFRLYGYIFFHFLSSIFHPRLPPLHPSAFEQWLPHPLVLAADPPFSSHSFQPLFLCRLSCTSEEQRSLDLQFPSLCKAWENWIGLVDSSEEVRGGGGGDTR